jgi:NADH-quinone oxidoreductase subunit G
MPTVTINGQTIEVEPGTVIIEAARRLGIKIPHFCWHEALRPSGCCRVCLVDVEKARGPQVACMSQCADGMVVRTDSEAAIESQNAVMEFLLLNHPLDCTICDQAGECKLQRYSYNYGKAASRLDLEKVKKPKAVPFSEHIIFDAERCVLCTRCVRFFQDVRDTSILGLINRGTYNEIAVAEGETIDDAYSMNIIDICPVGALTARDFRFQSRVWFLDQTDSVCTGCAKGCNIQISSRDGETKRFVPRTNPAVNGHWMCDEGRLSYKNLLTETRLTQPLVRMGGELEEVEWTEALDRAHEMLVKVDGPVDFVASTVASLEDLWLFRRLSEKLETARLVRVTPTGEGDGFLVQEDRSANSAGADLLDYPAAGKGKLAKAVVVLGDALHGVDLPEKLELLVVFGWNRGELSEAADVVLPLAGFAEVDQTYVNLDRRLQLARKAIHPPGDACPGYVALPGLERRFDQATPQYRMAEVVFGELKNEVSGLAEAAIPRMLRIDPLGLSLDGDHEREAV